MKKFIIFAVLLQTYLVHAHFMSDSLSQYRGNCAFQAKDFKKAQEQYCKILDNNPYDPQANYNVGVALYKQKRYEDCLPYFSRASNDVHKNSLLKEQALFNQGNAYVQLKKLDEALKSYEQVLQINPKNQHAQQNADLVKKMMQQPPPEQNQDGNSDDQKDNKQNNKNEKQKQNKNDQKSNDQRSNDQRSNDQRSNEQDSDELNEQEKQEQEGSEQKKQQGHENDKRDSQEKQSNGNDAKDQKDQQLEKSKEQKRDGKQKDQQKQQDQSLQKSEEQQGQSTGQDEKDKDDLSVELQDQLAEQVESKPEDDERLDKRNALVMQKMSEHEDNLQKQILKKNVSKPGAANYGQKNW